MGKRSQARLKKKTVSIWDKLNKVKIKNKEKSLDAFVNTVKEVEKKKYKFKEGTIKKDLYYIVNEPERNGGSFVHIVPKEAYNVFEEMRKMMPDSFLGFSMLCGKIKGKDLRVSCFAITSSEITKALISKKNK